MSGGFFYAMNIHAVDLWPVVQVHNTGASLPSPNGIVFALRDIPRKIEFVLYRIPLKRTCNRFGLDSGSQGLRESAGNLTATVKIESSEVAIQ